MCHLPPSPWLQELQDGAASVISVDACARGVSPLNLRCAGLKSRRDGPRSTRLMLLPASVINARLAFEVTHSRRLWEVPETQRDRELFRGSGFCHARQSESLVPPNIRQFLGVLNLRKRPNMTGIPWRHTCRHIHTPPSLRITATPETRT